MTPPAILALDFDGVLCDGMREYFEAAWRAYRRLRPAVPPEPPTDLFERFARLILSVDVKTWAVRKAVVYDQFENTVTMRLTKVAINASLPDRLFTFVVPKGVATVPLR